MPTAPTGAGPAPATAQPLADLSGLDDNQGAGVRRLRSILIGCGACQKTIKVPESRLGKTTACKYCGTLLKVDAFNLSKTKGDLIDMTHLELEKADLLADDGSHGSTLGGSSIQIDGSDSMAGTGGYELNAPPSGSMSGVSAGNSQTQMRELRELNDLKHSGQITADEYRERKKEIYSGKTLAIQAMSRSADGTGNRPVLKQDDKPALLPGPVKALLAVAVIGAAGFGAWSYLNGSGNAAPPPTESVTTTTPTEAADPPEEMAPVEPVETDLPPVAATENPPPETAAEATPPGPIEETPPIELVELVSTPDAPISILEVEPDLGVIGSETTEVPAEPIVQMRLTGWDTSWPAYPARPDDNRAIAKACDLLQRMTVRDDSAIIGVALGPAADSLDSPAYEDFRQSMTDILTNTAVADNILDDLNIRTSERTAKLGTIEAHRLHVTSKSNRGVRAAVLTGIQDGYCVSYWFAGARSLYTDFLDTVGKAEFAPAN